MPAARLASPFLVLALSLLTAVPVAAQADSGPIAQALQQLQHGDADAAVVTLDKALAGAPNDSMLLWCRAYVHGQRGDFERGIADATAAIQADPKNHRALIERGYQYGRQGRHLEAIADFDRAIALQPGEATAFGDRGDSRQALTDYDAAIADYTEALRLRPGFGPAALNRGHCWRKLGHLTAAREDYRQAAQLLGDDAGLWLDIADVEADAGRLADAIGSVDHVLEKDPHAHPLLAMRSRLRWRMGDIAKGIEDLQHLLTEPVEASVLVDGAQTLGCMQLCSGDVAGAGKSFAIAARSASGAGANWSLLMQWCARAREDRARADGVLAAELADPQFPMQPLEKELFALCARGDGDSPALPLPGRTAADACPLLFFSAWRAELAGRRPEALRKLVRCVNTGQIGYLQWLAADDLVRRWTKQAPLPVGLGVDWEPKEGGLSVTALQPAGAGAAQGLQVGDLVVRIGPAVASAEAWRAMGKDLRVGTLLRIVAKRGGRTEVLWLRAGCESP